PIWSLGRSSTAFLPASIASAKRPSFISAMPSACQPSKKSGAISTQRRYFATALSRSPTAMSPLASSKISSADCSIKISRAHTGAATAPLAFAKLKAGCLLPVAQPFVKNNALLVIDKPFLKRCLLLAGICVSGWLALFQNTNKSVITRRGKIADLARIQECHGLFDGRKIGRLVLRFLAFGRRFVLRFLALGRRFVLWFLGLGERLVLWFFAFR